MHVRNWSEIGRNGVFESSGWGSWFGDNAHLHDLILELGEEVIHDLVLLDGERVEVDLLHALNLAGLDETTELGDGLPLLLVVLVAAATSTSTATATAAITTTITTSSKAAAAGTSSPISHDFDVSVGVERGDVVVVELGRSLQGGLFSLGGEAFCCEFLETGAQSQPTLKFFVGPESSHHWCQLKPHAQTGK